MCAPIVTHVCAWMHMGVYATAYTNICQCRYEYLHGSGVMYMCMGPPACVTVNVSVCTGALPRVHSYAYVGTYACLYKHKCVCTHVCARVYVWTCMQIASVCNLCVLACIYP